LTDTCDTQPAHIRSGRPQWCRTDAGSSRIGGSQDGDKGVCHGCRYAPRSATPAAMHCLIELVDEDAMRRSEIARAPAQWVRKVALLGQQRRNSRRRPRRRGIWRLRSRDERSSGCLGPRHYAQAAIRPVRTNGDPPKKHCVGSRHPVKPVFRPCTRSGYNQASERE